MRRNRGAKSLDGKRGKKAILRVVVIGLSVWKVGSRDVVALNDCIKALVVMVLIDEGEFV